MAGLCRNAVKQDVDFNLHFFMNTTTGIGRALRYANVPPELVKNVCRPDDENREKLAGYSIDSPTGQPRKINFYTSTAFEGCDIYDPKGRIYIVSDGSIKHTMQDVSTSIRQIAGRIRDTRYKEITHLFSQSRYGKDVDYKKFQEATDYEIDRAKRWLKHRDTADEDLRDGIYFHSQYINKKTMQFDNNRPKLDMMNYRN